VTARPPEPGDRPARRVLDRAPSERLAAAAAAANAVSSGVTGSLARAFAWGVAAAAGGLAAWCVTALVFLWVGLLLLVAVTAGVFVGTFVRYGAGTGVAAPSAAVRRGLALVLAVAVVVFGLAIAWATSGQFLGPFDFIGEVYGLTVPLQLAGAAVGTLAGAR